MRAHFIGFSLLVLASTLGHLPVLHAQQQSAELVPKELALALLPDYSALRRPEPQLRVGHAPEGFPRDVLPPGVEVLGSLANHRGTVVVAALPGDEAAAERVLAERLSATGWERRESFSRQGGFEVDVPRAPAWLADSLRISPTQPHLQSATFCRGAASLRAWALPRSAGGSLLRIEFDERAPSFICGRAADERPMLPLLTKPSGTRITSGGQSSGGTHMEARAKVVSELGLAGLLTHYASQLQKAGWNVGSRTTAQAVVTQQLSFRDTQGQLWQGMLLVLELPGAKEKEVSIRVSREGSGPGELMP
jgi:hypothetical protein